MMTRHLLLLIPVCFLMSCADENPFVSRDVINAIREAQNPRIENVVCIFNNDIYLFENLESTPQKITNTPTEAKTQVRISYDHSKIAYLNSDRTPVIIDRQGNVLEILTQHTNVKQMDWSANGETLYMLIGNLFVYHGPELDVPQIAFVPGITASEKRVLSASISPNGDITYIWYYFFGGYKTTRVTVSAAGAITSVDYAVFNRITFVHYAASGDYVYGFNPNENKTVYEKVELYNADGSRPVFDDIGHTVFSSPVYREDGGYIILGAQQGISGPFELTAYSMINSDNNKIRADFNSSSGSGLSVDWK